jgi:hypothetical protein
VLCDASEKAFAAVTYLRIVTGNIIETSFVMCGKNTGVPIEEHFYSLAGVAGSSNGYAFGGRHIRGTDHQDWNYILLE